MQNRPRIQHFMVSLGECAKVVRKKYNLAWLIESRIFPSEKIGHVTTPSLTDPPKKIWCPQSLNDEQIERISVSIPLFSGTPMTQPDQGCRGEPLGVRQGEPQRGVQRLLHHQLPGARRPRAAEGAMNRTTDFGHSLGTFV